MTEIAKLPHVFNCILQQCTWDGMTHKEQEERMVQKPEKKPLPMFKPVDFAEKDGSRYLAIGDTDSAIIEYAAGPGWIVYHLPGMGMTIGNTLMAYHSICRLDELQPAFNRILHPEHYQKFSEVKPPYSAAHRTYRRRMGEEG